MYTTFNNELINLGTQSFAITIRPLWHAGSEEEIEEK